MITEIMIILVLVFGGTVEADKPVEPVAVVAGNGGGGCPGGICKPD